MYNFCMKKIYRKCTKCSLEAKSFDMLTLFVSDKTKHNNYYTKSICKSCNTKISKEKRNGTYIYPDKSTRCKDCSLKPKDDEEREKLFVKEKTMKSGYANLCKKCASKRTMRHQKENPEMFRQRVRKYAISKYGITLEKYKEILINQNNACAICKRHKSLFTKELHVDHNHSCCQGKTSCGKCVRGILCPECNMMIGLSKDSVETLKHAIIYLDKGGRHQFPRHF
jgi:hypothetical protein